LPQLSLTGLPALMSSAVTEVSSAVSSAVSPLVGAGRWLGAWCLRCLR